jgi:hypothetical protein
MAAATYQMARPPRNVSLVTKFVTPGPDCEFSQKTLVISSNPNFISYRQLRIEPKVLIF